MTACSYGKLEYVRVAHNDKDGAKTFAQANDVLRQTSEFTAETNCRDDQFVEVGYRHSERISVGVFLYIPKGEVFLLFSELGVRDLSPEAKALLGKLIHDLASKFGATAVQDSLNDASMYKKVHAITGDDWRSPLCQRR
jgi:hypothetical protein